MIELRPGVPGDGTLIAMTRQKCWAATYRGIFPDEVIDDFDFETHISRDEVRLARPDFHYVLVLDGGQCVGYLSHGAVAAGTYRDFSYRVQSLYLLGAYQKQGLGRKLMQLAFDACRDAGCDKLFWECSPYNRAAIGFYEHLGAVMTEVDSGHENRQEDACYFVYRF